MESVPGSGPIHQGELVRSLLDTWRANPLPSMTLDAPERRRAFEAQLWATDSSGMLEALSVIMLDDDLAEMDAAIAASDIYRTRWGRPAPLLADWRVQFIAGNWPRVLRVFDALRAPAPPEAQPVLFGLACDAAWLVLALAAEPAFVRAYDPPNTDGWPYNSLEVVKGALDLLTGEYRDALIAYLQPARPTGVLRGLKGVSSRSNGRLELDGRSEP